MKRWLIDEGRLNQNVERLNHHKMITEDSNKEMEGKGLCDNRKRID